MVSKEQEMNAQDIIKIINEISSKIGSGIQWTADQAVKLFNQVIPYFQQYCNAMFHVSMIWFWCLLGAMLLFVLIGIVLLITYNVSSTDAKIRFSSDAEGAIVFCGIVSFIIACCFMIAAGQSAAHASKFYIWSKAPQIGLYEFLKENPVQSPVK
jgi:hypothetical protein